MEDSYLNLTQHSATPDQIKAGVFEPEDKELVQKWLTFTSKPSKEDIIEHASMLTSIARQSGFKKIMIGGAPYLMGTLEAFLKAEGLIPVYAWSERVSVDIPQEDGSVRKVNSFRHAGFIEL